MAPDDCEELMQAWFPKVVPQERKPLSETDLREISQVLLRTSDVRWSRIPRIYSVLRMINQLEEIENFLREDITDVWFPFSQKTLPTSFRSQSARLEFLDTQHLVFNIKAFNLEREDTKHGHFPDSTEIPLKKIGELGKGGYGFVDRVVSTISHKVYARKLIPRGRTFKKDKQVLRAFERELSNLKCLKHRHIIELVGSYTDPKYVGIIMLPVADCNLHEFLIGPLGDDDISLLRTFFGCLASALCFLHDSRIRHKDIKPQNVLIKDGHVFLTDFGISLDWSELNQSTTTGPTWTTPRYAAPEVADHSARNTSADMWSLGCVYLEMWTVLKRKTLSDLRNHLEGTGTKSPCYCSNIPSMRSWMEKIKALPVSLTDNAPLKWIASLLKTERDNRWNSHMLTQQIYEHSSDPTTPFSFAGLCCLDHEDTAESVHSSTGESINELAFRPKVSDASRPHASAATASSNAEREGFSKASSFGFRSAQTEEADKSPPHFQPLSPSPERNQVFHQNNDHDFLHHTHLVEIQKRVSSVHNYLEPRPTRAEKLYPMAGTEPLHRVKSEPIWFVRDKEGSIGTNSTSAGSSAEDNYHSSPTSSEEAKEQNSIGPSTLTRSKTARRKLESFSPYQPPMVVPPPPPLPVGSTVSTTAPPLNYRYQPQQDFRPHPSSLSRLSSPRHRSGVSNHSPQEPLQNYTHYASHSPSHSPSPTPIFPRTETAPLDIRRHDTKHEKSTALTVLRELEEGTIRPRRKNLRCPQCHNDLSGMRSKTDSHRRTRYVYCTNCTAKVCAGCSLGFHGLSDCPSKGNLPMGTCEECYTEMKNIHAGSLFKQW